MNYHNLPSSAVERIPERHQEALHRVNPRLYLIWCGGRRVYQLVERCGVQQGYVRPVGEKVPGWAIVYETPGSSYSIDWLLESVQRWDSHTYGGHAQKAASQRAMRDDIVQDFSRRQSAEQEAVMAGCAENAAHTLAIGATGRTSAAFVDGKPLRSAAERRA